MSLLAVTVIGHDRPGIIADVTGALANLGINLEDSTMTLLRGHFAMMLICSGSAAAADPAAVDSEVAQVEGALAPLAAGRSLVISVRPVPPEPGVAATGAPYVLSVHGGDRPGIVSAVTRVLADVGGNITDLTTRLSGDLYVLVAEVDVPGDVDIANLQARLRHVAGELGVDVSLRPQETDVL